MTSGHKQKIIEKDENGNVQKGIVPNVEDTKTIQQDFTKSTQDERATQRIRKMNVFLFIYLYSGAFYGLWLLFTAAKTNTIVLTLIFAWANVIGVSAGAHRLWAHKCYKAKLPLRIILMLFQTGAHQNPIYEWARDHRVHHKFTDTDADPHNATRGFFFSHIGWLIITKHPEVLRKGKAIDMSDLEADPVVMFQKKYFKILMPILCFFVPSLIPWYYFGEPWWTAWYVGALFRYCLTLNGVWLVNSAAHMWGTKPYDKNIGPTNSGLVIGLCFGEGWHNYHHVFPWDYKSSEWGRYELNWSKAFIDLFAKFGWAYDLKTVSDEMIRKRVLRTGDGTHSNYKEKIGDDKVRELFNRLIQNGDSKPNLWGWDDKDMAVEEKLDAHITYRQDGEKEL